MSSMYESRGFPGLLQTLVKDPAQANQQQFGGRREKHHLSNNSRQDAGAIIF